MVFDKIKCFKIAATLLLPLGLIVLQFGLVPAMAHAQGLVPCGHTVADACKVQDFFVLVARVINFLIGVAGVYAVFKIVQHGLMLVVSRGDEEAISSHKKGLTNVIIGFVLALAAFMLVNTMTNIVLNSKCKVDLKNPLTYLTINSGGCQ